MGTRARATIGLMAVLLLASPAVAVGEIVEGGATYVGLTNQRKVCRVGGVTKRACTVTIKTSANASRIVRLKIYWRAACANTGGATYPASTIFEDMPIRHRSEFGISGTYSEGSGAKKATITVALNGGFLGDTGEGAKAQGTFTATVRTKLDGKNVTCRSGRITFSAKA